MKRSLFFLCLTIPLFSFAQDAQNKTPESTSTVQAVPVVTEPAPPAAMTPVVEVKKEEPKKHWYEQISLRGYAQLRYNRLLETNDQLKCEQCDKSWGDNGGFYFRRVRMIFSGNVSDRVFIYIQPDFASTATALHFVQLRDAYFDLALDEKKEFRIRFGQSKVPYGFENLQSSQNRLPFDRDDALNSAAPNERDIGVFFYWAPEHIRTLFADINSKGLKGSGDYGVVGFGLYNGQSANRPEANNTPHVVARVSYPFQFANGQIFEPGIQAYTGKYVVTADQISPGVTGNPDFEYIDQRGAISFVLYPQPFGFQAEYNVGKGPEFDPATSSIREDNLHGGYLLAEYMIKAGKQIITPYTRAQYYDGGKKQELDARSYNVKELEMGVEWQPVKAFELTAAYTIARRRFEDFVKPINQQNGRLLRLQVQFNY